MRDSFPGRALGSTQVATRRRLLRNVARRNALISNELFLRLFHYRLLHVPGRPGRRLGSLAHTQMYRRNPYLWVCVSDHPSHPSYATYVSL